MENQKILYSAVVLDNDSHTTLLRRFHLPEGWDGYAHHCTICLGPLPEEWKKRIGEEVELDITHYGLNNLAIAVKVDNFNRIIPGMSHITIGVNKAKGGKPKDSNTITDWSIQLSSPIKVYGTIQEIKN